VLEIKCFFKKSKKNEKKGGSGKKGDFFLLWGSRSRCCAPAPLFRRSAAVLGFAPCPRLGVGVRLGLVPP